MYNNYTTCQNAESRITDHDSQMLFGTLYTQSHCDFIIST